MAEGLFLTWEALRERDRRTAAATLRNASRSIPTVYLRSDGGPREWLRARAARLDPEGSDRTSGASEGGTR